MTKKSLKAEMRPTGRISAQCLPRKALSLLLVIVMLFTMLPTALAANLDRITIRPQSADDSLEITQPATNMSYPVYMVKAPEGTERIVVSGIESVIIGPTYDSVPEWFTIDHAAILYNADPWSNGYDGDWDAFLADYGYEDKESLFSDYGLELDNPPFYGAYGATNDNYNNGEYTITLAQAATQNDVKRICPELTYDDAAQYYTIPIDKFNDEDTLKTEIVLCATVGCILVQVGGKSGDLSLSDEDKKPLNDLLTSANGVTNEKWYNEEDRYNGTPADTITDADSGFWKEFTAEGGPRAEAQSVLENATSVEQITEATEALQTAIDKLIPSEELNATELYETIQKYTTGRTGYYETNAERPDNPQISGGKLGKLLSDYTEDTANAFRAARDEAKAYLASLFDENGGATAENVAENQSKADGYAAALEDAVNALARPLTAEEIATRQRYRDTIVALNGLFSNLRQDDYTEESWSTFASAQAAATATLEANLTELLKDPTDKTVFPPYQSTMDAYYKAAYGLVPKGEATVTLLISDSKAMRGEGEPLPADLLLHEQTVTLNGETGYRLIDLLAAAGIDETEAKNNFGVNVLVYINGVLVRNPIYSTEDTILSVPLGRGDYYGRRWDQLIHVRNGDVVTVSRVEHPDDMYFIHPVDAAFAKLTAGFAQLHFADASAKTAAEGGAIPLQVQKTLSFILNQDGRSSAAANMELVVYGPQNPDGSYPTTPTRTGLTTDASGNVTLKLYQAGTYLVTAIDTREQDINASFYPQITVAAAPLTVTVTPLSDDAFAAEKAAYIAEVDALLNTCDADVMGPEPYAQAQTAAETAKGIISAAESLAEARAAVETTESTINALVEAAATANEEAVRKMTNLLLVLPSAEDIAAGRVFYGDLTRFSEASMHYYQMSEYQRGQLTGAQTAQWDALTAWFAENTAQPKEITVTIEVVGGYGDRISGGFFGGQHFSNILKPLWGSEFPISGSIENLSNPVTKSIPAPFEWLGIRLTANVSDEYEIYDFAWEGVDFSDTTLIEKNEDGVTIWVNANSISVFDTQGIPMDTIREDVKLTIYTRSASDAGAMRDAALQALTDAYNAYNKADYTTDGWTALTKAYNDGLAAVRAAADADITSVKDNALAAMAAVKTRRQEQASGGMGVDGEVGELGSVYVTVTNDTYPGGDFTGTFISETVALNEDTTMMTALLAALERNSYDWTGTGGTKGANSYDDWDISYISSIEKDGKRLAEFSSTSGSGWMGTLNDWFVNEGLNAFTASAGNANYRIVDGDVIAIQFTEDLGVDLGGGWGDPDTSLKALNVTGGTLSPAFKGSTTEYVLMLDDSSVAVTPAASNKNYQVRTYINEQSGNNWYRRGTTLPVKSGDVIYVGVGVSGWPSMNSNPGYEISYTATWYTITVADSSSADGVIDLINDIGTISYSNYKTMAKKVELAREAYDALNSDAKANVTNYDKLTAAEERITFFEEIDNVKSLLNAIPAADKLKKSDKSKVEAAQAAYEKLDAEQQGYITMSDLKKYNEAVEWLEEQGITISGGTITKDPDEEAASQVIKLIDAIGTVTKDSEAAIKAAHEAYDKLSSKQKELVSNYDVLVAAEAEYAKLTSGIKFTDVAETDFFYDAVQWAVEKGITNGTSETTLSPNASCTRAQMVTFLWRAAGEPKAKTTTCVFTDVDKDDYYYEALLWAVENGITKGASDTTFSPDASCTRGQMATFLYRNAKTPAVTGDHPFTDVKTDAYYNDAVIWAAAEGITNGTSATTFSPDADCTRGQMVTFLYRYLAE